MAFPSIASAARSGVTLLTLILLQTGCAGLRDVADRYEEVNIVPSQVATWAERQSADCRTPPRLDTGAIPPAPFVGMGSAGVGYAGLYEVRARKQVYRMEPALEFDLSAVPPESGNPLLVATLTFTEAKTPRTVSSRTCADAIVESVEMLSADWGPGSDFRGSPASRRFTTVPCERSAPSAGSTTVSCNVSVAVQRWLSQPTRYPNHGFLIRAVPREFDNCSINIGEPGDRLDCVAGLQGIALRVLYQPAEP